MKRSGFPVWGVVVPMVVGSAVAFFVYRTNGSVLNSRNLVSDVLFAQGSCVLMWALIHVLGNARAFTFVSYGFKRLHALWQGKKHEKSSEVKEDYIKYRDSRPVHDDVKWLLVSGAALMVLSLVVTFL